MKAEREQSMTSENEMLQSCFQCVSGVPEKKESWRELLYRFTQETTFHGVRYITDETPYILRRLLWILIVSSATALFTWFVVERIILLMRHPKAVDVEVIFNQTIDFPTVTVCNQNFFRKTAAHYYGLHDMIENGYQSLQGSNIKEDDNGDESVMHGFELKMDLFLDGIGNSYTKYVNITAQVCKLTCLEVVSDSCCSLVYNKRSKTCYITAMETQMPGVSLIPKKGFDYYRRKKCEVQTSAQCDFEQSVCNFVVDFTMVLIWKVTSNERRDAGKPTFDHTKMSTKGKYLRVSTAYQQSDAVGHLLSPYFLSGNNTCITFYYQIRSGTLNIKIGVQNELDVVWSRGSSASTDWELAFARLRSGYFRVVIEASSKLKNSATEKVDISIDDVSIGECPPIMECRTSPMALGYGGSKTSAESKNKCQPWNGVLPSGLPPQFWSFGNVSTSGNDVLSQEQNYCRNPDNDIRGPWCFTDLKTMQMEYCDIPYCPCRSFEFMCSNKRCIAKEQVCDNVNDCGDLTDERDCTHKLPVPSVNCTFEQTWNCTYLNDPSYKPLWSTRNGGVGEVIGVDTGKAKVGDVASLVSPPFTIFDVGCLQFEFQLTMDEILEVNYKVDEKALYKHHLCTVRGGIDTEKHWYVTRLDLPPGTYSVVFDATIYSGKLAKLNLDNITVTEGNCTDPYEVTTMWMTTDFNVTTESTETTLEYENETTTPIYISPTLPSINRTQDLNATSPPPTNLTTPAVAAVTNATENVTEWDNSTMTTMEVMTTPEPYVYDPACVWDEWTCGGCMQPMAPAPANGTQPECDEDIGITCQFVDDCRCGYRMTASNINWQWQSSYTESFPENVTVDMTGMDLFLEPLSETPIEGDWIRLFSPIMTIDTVSCVSFQYFTRYMDIRVLIYNEETVMEMMEITYDGQAPAWHPVDMTLTEGQWGIAFDYIYARFSEDNAGIDNITLTPGICDSSSANPSVNCTFDDPEWCGYKERSPKYRNWFRSQSLTQQGKNYIRTRSTEDGKLSRRLLSPDFSITQLSCLQFDYFGQGKNKELEVKTISATLTSSTGSETIWKIYGVIDNVWHKGKALIKPGRYTLRLDINGDSFRGGFDEILVTPGGCPQINCSETEYRCRSLLACIGMEQMCDGIINCPGGEDESVEECGEEDKTTDEDDGDQVGGDTETIDTDNLASEIEEITKLEELYWQVGHQGDDFIYKCEWDSIECSDHNFTKQVTDYGVCYTFNERSLNTSKTGARFGLRLTLNIEQYEYMIGPNTDAGIKMFLHAKDEVPQVRDLGFAISPGQHALVGIMRNEAENLEAPWGECDVTDLYYYDSYLYSRCVVDCETKYLVDMCQCRDAYMPNRTADDPPICNFTSYFDCAAPMLNKLGAAEEGQAEEDKCHNCPKPCNQTVYEPALSYALLSSMSVDQILTSEASILQTKYDNALETRQRTDGEIFVNDLKRIGALERSYLDAIRLSKEYLISDGAVFPKVLQVVNTINEDAFIADMNTLLGIINEFKRIYTETYEERKSFLFSSAEVFGRTLSEVDQLLYLTVKKNKVHEYLKQFAGNGIVQSVLLKETLEILAENLKNTTVAAGTNVANLAFMPVHFYQNPTDCTTKTEQFIETLTTLTYDFKQIEKYSNSVSRLRSIYLDLQDNTRDFENEHMSVKACLNEYPGAVDDTISFREDALKQADNIRSHISSTSFDVLDIITDLNSEYEAVIQIYKMYISGVVKKMTMLQEVLKTEQEEVTPTQVITTFFSKIKTKVSDPLRQIIQETQTTLTSLYPKSLEKAAFLSNYLKDHFFYDNAEFMVLWREPIPNIDVPTPLSVNGTELWKVWDRTTLITDFVKRTENPETGVISSPAETEIKRILNYYFTPLLERIDTFEQQLSTVVNDLTTAVEEIDAEYVQYTARRLIDHLFVSDNFMNVDVYFKQLKFQKVKQIRAYELQQFLSDVGGYMGLLLGASVLTIFELLDLILYNGVKKYCLAKGKSYDTGGTVENGSKGLENNDKGIYDPMPAQTHAI